MALETQQIPNCDLESFLQLEREVTAHGVENWACYMHRTNTEHRVITNLMNVEAYGCRKALILFFGRSQWEAFKSRRREKRLHE